MKTFKFLLPIVAMFLIGLSSCSKDDDPNLEPNVQLVYKTFIVILEETPDTYAIGISYMEGLRRTFPNSVVDFDNDKTITAKIPETNVERFLEIMNKSKYIVSVTEF